MKKRIGYDASVFCLWGWMDGWMDGWIHGWMDGKKSLIKSLPKPLWEGRVRKCIHDRSSVSIVIITLSLCHWQPSRMFAHLKTKPLRSKNECFFLLLIVDWEGIDCFFFFLVIRWCGNSFNKRNTSCKALSLSLFFYLLLIERGGKCKYFPVCYYTLQQWKKKKHSSHQSHWTEEGVVAAIRNNAEGEGTPRVSAPTHRCLWPLLHQRHLVSTTRSKTADDISSVQRYFSVITLLSTIDEHWLFFPV